MTSPERNRYLRIAKVIETTGFWPVGQMFIACDGKKTLALKERHRVSERVYDW